MELIHTCCGVTDPECSVASYDALGFEKRREPPIRDEAVNYFLGVPGKKAELELTYNFETPHGGYKLGTGYGTLRSPLMTSTGRWSASPGAEQGVTTPRCSPRHSCSRSPGACTSREGRS